MTRGESGAAAGSAAGSVEYRKAGGSICAGSGGGGADSGKKSAGAGADTGDDVGVGSCPASESGSTIGGAITDPIAAGAFAAFAWPRKGFRENPKSIAVFAVFLAAGAAAAVVPIEKGTTPGDIAAGVAGSTIGFALTGTAASNAAGADTT